MKTEYRIYRPGKTEPEIGNVDWPESPGLDRLHELLDPINGVPPAEVAARAYGPQGSSVVGEVVAMPRASKGGRLRREGDLYFVPRSVAA